MTGIDRFLEIMDAPAEIVDAPDAKVLTDVRGEVAFDHVSFHYQDDDAEVIHNLNMTVRPGQSIALVGRSSARWAAVRWSPSAARWARAKPRCAT